ncbi:MAG: TIGR02221 family CRISPR-associated protein [Gammaproteobacteria bacterium]|nr:TIGR02221 family CRISPR-associated protein [Gammaproteobacteria bacterium]
MTHTLVTFLGRPRFADNRDREYRTATYRFPGGRCRTSAFFGLALADHLKVNRLVILGTSGSMWGVLVSDLADRIRMTHEDEKIINLLEAEEAGQVTVELLSGLTNTMTCAVGRTVTPRLIPFAKTMDEQLEILQAVSDAVPDDEDVSFDLTHGFRHLGMVGFLSAFMLEQVKRMNVCGLWYGALDMTRDEITPVLRLDGLNRVRRWMDALSQFDASGDYGVFAPLLKDDNVGKKHAQFLKGAAFHERTLNISRAACELQKFLPALDTLEGVSKLFRDQLHDRLKWSEEDLAKQQRSLAFEYLKRRDFMRAAVLGWEAQVTKECARHPQLNPEDHGGRTRALRRLRTRRREGGQKTKGAFFKLQDIRNALAHGNPPRDANVRRILGDASRLERSLRQDFECLLNF